MREPELKDRPGNEGGVVALVGLPGSGKSTIGRRLAARLGLDFRDADAAIEQRAGLSVQDIFAQRGEPAFRDLEVEVLAELLGGSPAVVATGGGAVLREETRARLAACAEVVYLEASPAELQARVRADGKRPLLAGAGVLDRLTQLHAERAELYRRVATVTVPSGRRRPQETVRLICESIRLPAPVASGALRSP